MSRNGLWVRAIVMMASGMLLATLVAPYGLYALHWVAYLPMFWALRSDTPRANRWLLFLYGTVAEAMIFSWIADTVTLFSNLGSMFHGLFAYVILVVFAMLFGLPYLLVFGAVHPMRKRFGDLWIVALPAWLVIVEWLSTWVILFPYPQGTSQYRFPYTWQLASITGVWGLSYLVLFFNAALGEAIYRRREGRPFPKRWVASAVGILVAVLAFGAWRESWLRQKIEAAPVLRVAQLQSSSDMEQRMRVGRKVAFDEWIDSVKTVEPGSADLVVLPEGAIPFDLNTSTAAWILWDLARHGKYQIIAGAGTRERIARKDAEADEKIHDFNSVYLFDPRQLEVDPQQPDATATFKALGAGCDLDAAHVFTALEARALRLAGEAATQPAPDAPADAAGAAVAGVEVFTLPDPSAVACVQKLREREDALRKGAHLTPEDEPTVTADTFRLIRAQSARFAAPLHEVSGIKKGDIHAWIFRAADCPDDDCHGFSVRCTGDDCQVMPDAPHYDKMVPLPFGEYLPLAETFPILADWIKGPGDFRAGTEPLVFDAGGVRLSVPICYEAILGYVCKEFDHPDVLVNVTNDAWFGRTAASDLHGMLAAARSIELGVPMFRSAYSGVSFVVDPDGQIHDETPLYTKVERVVKVPLARVDTFYELWGNWFVGACGATLAFLLAARRAKA